MIFGDERLTPVGESIYLTFCYFDVAYTVHDSPDSILIIYY